MARKKITPTNIMKYLLGILLAVFAAVSAFNHNLFLVISSAILLAAWQGIEVLRKHDESKQDEALQPGNNGGKASAWKWAILIACALITLSSITVYPMIKNAYTLQKPSAVARNKPPVSTRTVVPSPTLTATAQISPTPMPTPTPTPLPLTSDEIYQRYVTGTPTQTYLPTDGLQLINGSPGQGNCQSNGAQNYHATTNGPNEFAMCLEPDSLNGSFVIQTEVTIVQGDGAALAFDYTGTKTAYMFGICRTTILNNCYAGNAWLDYANGRARCLGPGVDPHCAEATFPNVVQGNAGQPNTLTVIVLDGSIYTYVNGTWITTYGSVLAASYPNSGDFGIVAYQENQSTTTTDVTFQFIKVWSISS